jgi:hypothetical protein
MNGNKLVIGACIVIALAGVAALPGAAAETLQGCAVHLVQNGVNATPGECDAFDQTAPLSPEGVGREALDCVGDLPIVFGGDLSEC